MKIAQFFFCFTVLFVLSCAHSPQQGSTWLQVPKAAFQSADPNQITIAVVGMNDFHGHLLPRERKLPDGRTVESGGAAALASMVKILKTEMQGRVFISDGGDEWQGTLESNRVKGASVTEFFGRLGVKTAAIGNHEFDFSLKNFRERAKEAKYDFVASNIYEKKTKKRVNWEKVFPSRIVEVAGVKIGVIGVTTQDTPSTTRYEYVRNLDFLDPAIPVMTQAESLRRKGANAVMVTAHAGTICKDGPSPETQLKSWRLLDAASEQGICDERYEIAKLAIDVGPKTLDAIVAGHTHQIQHHWINQVPVVQGEAFNQYFNIIYFTFDAKTKKIIPELTRIEGLVPICTKFFEGTNHCDTRLLKTGESPRLVQATFHGQSVLPDQATIDWLAPIRAETDQYRNQVIAESELPLIHVRDREGPLTNLIADVLKDRAQSDFSLVNSGGIRTSLDAGKITYDGIFRTLPFDNMLNVIRIKGKEVKLLMQIATSGAHGFSGFSGLKLTVLNLNQPAPFVDLNKNGKHEEWEDNRLISIMKADGSPIHEDQYYTVATFDFLVNGGDDLHWFMSQLKKSQINNQFHDVCRDMVMDYLRKKKVFNTKADPLVNPAHPRLIVVDHRFQAFSNSDQPTS